MVGDTLDVLRSQIVIIIEANEHRPPMRVLMLRGRVRWFRVFNFFMRVAVCKAEKLLDVPLAVLLQLFLDLIELFFLFLLNLLLKVFVEDRNKELIEMSATERARQS